MRVYFNIYGRNLSKIDFSSIDMGFISFDSKGKHYELELAGSIDVTGGESFEGRIKCETIDNRNHSLLNESQVEIALSDCKNLQLHTWLASDDPIPYDVKLTCYDIQVIIGNTDKVAYGDI